MSTNAGVATDRLNHKSDSAVERPCESFAETQVTSESRSCLNASTYFPGRRSADLSVPCVSPRTDCRRLRDSDAESDVPPDMLRTRGILLSDFSTLLRSACTADSRSSMIMPSVVPPLSVKHAAPQGRSIPKLFVDPSKGILNPTANGLWKDSKKVDGVA